MSIYEVRTLGCSACGAVRTVKAVESANPERHPPFLAELLGRTLHRFRCDDCGHVDVLEDPLLWTDARVGLVAGMLPPSERPGWAALEIAVAAGLAGPLRDEGPAVVRQWGVGVEIRVVFGLEELREKVVAAHAGLDDRAVELCKVPYVDRVLAIGPSLDQVDGDGLHLRAGVAGATFTVAWATYERAVAALAADPAGQPGLVQGAWVHWLRAPYAPNEPVGAHPHG